MAKPLLSVLIDTYNHEKYIEQAVVSAIEQDFPSSEFELLVVDDGSTDRTAEIVRKFEPRVRLLQKANGGQASAINFGVAHAKGELVAFLDGDDLWLPSKLSRVVKEFEREPHPVLVYHRYCFLDVEENKTWEARINEVSGDILSDRRKLVRYWAAPTSSLTFRRAALERVMPIPEECSFMWDTYAVNTILFFGPVAAIGKVLTKNLVHGQNLWFVGERKADAEVLARRIKTRKAMIESIRNWARLNGAASRRSEIRTLLGVWQLIQDNDEFQLAPPGRFRCFVHEARRNTLYGCTMTSGDLVYGWVRALAGLVVGFRRVHYLEGVRTRIRRLERRVGRRIRPEERQGGTV
jgi:glycosyltransferase involved in cell wall biosynthesis